MSNRSYLNRYKNSKPAPSLKNLIFAIGKERSYAIRNLPFAVTAFLILVGIHFLQSYFAYNFITRFFGIDFGTYTTLLSVTILVLIALFSVFTFHSFWNEYYHHKSEQNAGRESFFPVSNLIGCILVIAFLGYLEFKGGEASVFNNIAEVQLTDISESTAFYDSEISTINNQIAANLDIIAKKSGSYSIQQRENERLQIRKDSLINQREAAKRRTEKRNDASETIHEMNTTLSASQKAYLGLGLGFFSFIFTWLTTRYVVYSKEDYALSENDSDGPLSGPNGTKIKSKKRVPKEFPHTALSQVNGSSSQVVSQHPLKLIHNNLQEPVTQGIKSKKKKTRRVSKKVIVIDVSDAKKNLNQQNKRASKPNSSQYSKDLLKKYIEVLDEGGYDAVPDGKGNLRPVKKDESAQATA